VPADDETERVKAPLKNRENLIAKEEVAKPIYPVGEIARRDH
jgi:hypothetical protein